MTDHWFRVRWSDQTIWKWAKTQDLPFRMWQLGRQIYLRDWGRPVWFGTREVR